MNNMLKLLIGTLFIGVLCLVCPELKAESYTSESTVPRQVNQAIKEIFDKVQAGRMTYLELASFGPSSMKQDGQFSRIVYRVNLMDGQQGSSPLMWQIRVEKFQNSEDEINTSEDGHAISFWKFPMLGIQIILDVSQESTFTSVELPRIIEAALIPLGEMEQKQLPFELSISTDKSRYRVGESIDLSVTLTNKSSQGFHVASLGENSLNCQIDTLNWGADGANLEPDTILPPKGTMTKKFKIQGIDASKQIEISCNYLLTYQGVKPYDRVSLTIEP